MRNCTYKRILALILSLILLVTLTGCSAIAKIGGGVIRDILTEEAKEETPSEHAGTGTATGTGTDRDIAPEVSNVPETDEEQGIAGDVVEEIAQEVKNLRWYPNNILMEQTGDYYGDEVFGNSSITHEDVTSVTFLDTLRGMPGDAWDVSEAQDGSVMAWLENGTDLVIAGEGGVTASSCRNLFSCFVNVTSINFNDCFYTDIAENMFQMFFRCEKLTELDLSFISTSSAVALNYMFGDCSGLQTLDLSSLDTSNAQSMAGMFSSCSGLQTLDVSPLDTSNVQSMEHMFWWCKGLTALDLSTFDTAQVRSFGGMFGCCDNLTALDLSNFDTGSAQDISGMFYGCPRLVSLDISSFNTAQVTNMQQMFMECVSLTNLDLSHFDTSNVERFGSMFDGCKNLETLDVSSFRTPAGLRFNSMFAYCGKLTVLDLSGFDFSKAEMTQEMFMNCTNLQSINCTIVTPEGCDTSSMYAGSGL